MSEEKQAAGGGAKKMILIGVGALVLVGAAVGGTLALTGGGKKAESTEQAAEGHGAEAEGEGAPAHPAVYIPLAPEFVVNFRDKNNRPKFLKAELSVATKDPAVEEAIKLHMPAIRNSLILLLSRQIYDDLMPNEGKEKLRAEALAAVQGVLEAQTGKPGIDDLFFATLVMH